MLTAGPKTIDIRVLVNTRMIYRFEPSCSAEQLDRVLHWSWYLADVEMWRGRCDCPGQYRFDWRIRVEGVRETEFLVRFSGVVEFVAEPDYQAVLV